MMTETKNLAMAEAYYLAMASGDTDEMGSYLQVDVKYFDPLWPLEGKDQVMKAAKNLSAAVDKINVGAKFSLNDQVMLVHELIFKVTSNPETEKPLNTAVLMTFGDGLIKQIELFYDTMQVQQICKEIFQY